MKDNKREISIVRSSAAEYLTFITATGESDVNAVYFDENVWLTQKMMGVLYNVGTNTINYHLKEIFTDREVDENSVIRKFRITAADGKTYNTNHYNLSAIIAVGNKVDSPRAIQFRKLAIHGETAAETIHRRADSEKENMGLTTWKDAPDGKILKRDISVAKNYLNEKELSRLNRLVTMFIDYAELMAEDEVLMSMQDWVEQTNQFLRNNRREVLEGKGKVSHDMVQKRQF